MRHHTTPDHTMPYHSMSHYALPPQTILYHTKPWHTILDCASSRHATPGHTISWYPRSYLITLRCTTLHSSRLYHTVPCHAIPNYTTPYHTMLCHTKPYYATPCYVLLNKLQKVASGLSLIIWGALSVFPSVHPDFVPFGLVNLCELCFWLLKLAPCSVPLDLESLQPQGYPPVFPWLAVLLSSTPPGLGELLLVGNEDWLLY